jgi:hypothetical protein
LWPENWPALRVYTQNSTQMRVVSGMAGLAYLGLDYNPIHHDLDRMGLAPEDYDDLMGSIRVIEGEALKLLNKT